MNDKDRELLRHISETLDEVLVVLSKQPKKWERVAEIAATGITIFGIFSIIDIIKSWIGG